MKQKILIFIFSAFCLSLFIVFFPVSEKEEDNCLVTVEEKIVRGNSMEPLIKSGTIVRVLIHDASCQKFKRGDLVIYGYAGNDAPIIKKIRGIPGDRFALQKNEKGGWNILINDRILKNSRNVPYALRGQAFKMLSLYARSYPVIPEESYLILGEKIGGTLDSSKFGLVSAGDIIGKAEVK